MNYGRYLGLLLLLSYRSAASPPTPMVAVTPCSPAAHTVLPSMSRERSPEVKLRSDLTGRGPSQCVAFAAVLIRRSNLHSFRFFFSDDTTPQTHETLGSRRHDSKNCLQNLRFCLTARFNKNIKPLVFDDTTQKKKLCA